jgi:hypothetical protein
MDPEKHDMVIAAVADLDETPAFLQRMRGRRQPAGALPDINLCCPVRGDRNGSARSMLCREIVSPEITDRVAQP